MKSTQSRITYIPALDGLRGIAILLVIAVHAEVPGLAGGTLGVDIFFVLSGYLITCLLLAEWQDTHAIDLPHFFFRRALRLLPALVVMLAVCVPLGLLAYTPRETLLTGVVQSAAAMLFYFANWQPWDYWGMFRHGWTLGVEEHFYLVWPLLCEWLLGRSKSWSVVLTLLAATFVLCVGLRALDSFQPGLFPQSISRGLRIYQRAEALLLGCALAICVTQRLLPNSLRFRAVVRAGAAVSLLGLLYLATWPTSALLKGGYALAALATCFVLLQAIVGPVRPIQALLTWKPLTSIGRVAYGLYLWHYPLFIVLLPRGPIHAALALVLTCFFVWVSWRYVEQPVLRIKNNWGHRALQPAAPRPPAKFT